MNFHNIRIIKRYSTAMYDFVLLVLKSNNTPTNTHSFIRDWLTNSVVLTLHKMNVVNEDNTANMLSFSWKS